MISSSVLTCELMVIAAVGSMAIACLFVWALQYLSTGWRELGILAMAAAAGLPLYVHTSGWEATWGKFGWLPAIRSGTRQWSIDGFFATAWIHTIVGAAGGALLVYFGYQTLTRKLLEAASIEADLRYIWMRIALPLLKPAIAAAGAWSALLVLTDMTVANLYAVRTLPDLVYQQFAISQTVGPALSVTFGSWAIVLTLWLVTRRTMLAEFSAPTFSEGIRAWQLPLAPRWQTALAFTVFCAVLTLVLGIPILGLVIKAGWENQLTDSGVSISVSIAAAGRTVRDALGQFSEELKWTALLACLVSILCLPLAWWNGRLASRGPGECVRMLLMLSLLAAIPGPVFALVTVWLFNLEWFSVGHLLYDQTLLPTAIAAMPRPLAVGTAVFSASRSLHGVAMHELVMLDGPAGANRFFRIELPLHGKAAGIAFLLMVLMTIGDLAAPLLVAPPGVQTVASRLFGLLHSGVRQQEAGLCLVTVAIESFLLFLALRLFHLTRSKS
jgi:iron(III) transport system permease protein